MHPFFSKSIVFFKHYMYDKNLKYNRIIQFAKLSALINAIIALGKIAMSIYSLSFFLSINGLYNLGVCLAKAISVKGHYDNQKSHTNQPEDYGEVEYRYYFFVGIIILITSLIYMLYCVKLFTVNNSTIQYNEIVAISIATLTFTEIVMAIKGIIMTRRDKEPVMEAVKMTNLVSSLISMVLTQTALMSFTQNGDISFYCGLSGIFFGSLSMLIGIYMIIHVKLMMHKKN